MLRIIAGLRAIKKPLTFLPVASVRRVQQLAGAGGLAPRSEAVLNVPDMPALSMAENLP